MAPAHPSSPRVLSGRSGSSEGGPFYAFRLQVEEGVVVAASYACHDCFWANTIGSAALVVVKDWSPARCAAITGEDIILVLTEAPPLGNRDLLGLACEGVRLAAAGGSVPPADPSPIITVPPVA